MVKAFMSELDKNQDENEFLHGRISELEAKNKRLQSELNKWTPSCKQEEDKKW